MRDSEERPDLLAALPNSTIRWPLAGATVIHYRAHLPRGLAEYAEASHRECSGGRETLTLRYETVKTVTDPFADLSTLFMQLSEHQREHKCGSARPGCACPGRTKTILRVLIGGVSAKSLFFPGQTRTAALSIKLAEREIYKNTVGEYPVLLLDDVLSELDARRQEFVLNRIQGGQVFITCCERRPAGSAAQRKGVSHCRRPGCVTGKEWQRSVCFHWAGRGGAPR